MTHRIVLIPGDGIGPEVAAATRLVLDAVTAVRQAGGRHLWVTGNPHALDFYLAVGFAEAGRVATEFGSGIRMHLDLTRTFDPPPRHGTPA